MSHLTAQPIDLPTLAAAITGPGRGAVTTFTGLVRDHHAGRQVTALSYSAYELMAEAICSEIVAETEQRWAVSVALAHRLGDLVVGDVAVAVAVGSDNRGAGFEACRWVIDEIKRRVPIWKHERYADGSSAWVDPTAPGGVAESPG